ncbi:MAG: sugar phosphate isomerase/epimerase family protein [Candidatus Nanohaloarchaea archaeon]
MRLGVSIGPFPESVEDVPSDFDFVELSIGEHEIDPEKIDREELEKVLDEKGFDLVVHLPFRQPLATTVPELNEANRDYLDRLLSFSSEFGASKAVVHANLRDPDSEEELEELESQVERVDELGTQHDIEVCFENVRHVDTPELMELGEILENADASMCFDIGHAFISADEDEVAEFLESHRDLVSHLHVHDIRDRGDSHIAVGEGNIDFADLAEELSGFDGSVCFELFTDDMDYVELSRDKFLQHF